ncbi:MAG: hypothetical protein ACOCPW_05260 [Marinilabiliaceae bacterium]
MKKVVQISLFFLVFSSGPVCQAQIWPFNKRSQQEKAREELRERKQEAGEGNLFNPLQSFGEDSRDLRNDHIRSASTASLSYPGAGNISLTNPSRYGTGGNVEWLSWLGFMPWTPNLFFKRQISADREWLIASLHGVYTSYPGLQRVDQGKDSFLADSLSANPRVISVRNQIITSRLFYDGASCNPGQPYLMLSASLGVDFGVPFSDEDVYLNERHFFTPRSMAYNGQGWVATLALRGDWQINPYLYLRGGLRTLTGNFPGTVAWEQHGSVEYFLSSAISVSGGYNLGFGNINSSAFGLLPFLDISFYFGKKQTRRRALFEQQMF